MRLVVAGAIAVLSLTKASAIINAPVPANAYITQGGLDWAWALPLPAENGLDLSYQSQFGWRLPTLEELQNGPDATDFLFAGANVPFLGTDPVSGASFDALYTSYTDAQSAGAVAAPYFSNINWVDWLDGQGVFGRDWAGLPGAPSYADQLVVRVSVSSVPEGSSTAWLLLLGLGAMMAGRRRRPLV